VSLSLCGYGSLPQVCCTNSPFPNNRLQAQPILETPYATSNQVYTERPSTQSWTTERVSIRADPEPSSTPFLVDGFPTLPTFRPWSETKPTTKFPHWKSSSNKDQDPERRGQWSKNQSNQRATAQPNGWAASSSAPSEDTTKRQWNKSQDNQLAVQPNDTPLSSSTDVPQWKKKQTSKKYSEIITSSTWRSVNLQSSPTYAEWRTPPTSTETTKWHWKRSSSLIPTNKDV
jgi:hypothetical protein